MASDPIDEDTPENEEAKSRLEHIRESKHIKEFSIETRLKGYDTIEEQDYDAKENIKYAQENSMENVYPIILSFLGVATIGISFISGEMQKVPLYIGIGVFTIGVYWHIHVKLKRKSAEAEKMRIVDEMNLSGR